MHRRLLLPALVILLSTAGARAAQPSAPATHSMAATIPAAGITSLDLHTVVGDVNIRPTAANEIKIRVLAKTAQSLHFIFDWTTGHTTAALPKGLHLVIKRHGGTAAISLSTQTGAPVAGTADKNPRNFLCIGACFGESNSRSWRAHWTILLPRQMHLKLKGGVVNLHVRGIAGGLDATVGIGTIEAFLPQGPVTAKAGLGKVDVRVASGDYGHVDLKSGVGGAEFRVDGKHLTKGYHRSFTSSTQKVAGQGKTDYDIETGVGPVVLELGQSLDTSTSGNGDE